jgi:hypothetical protein
MKHLLLLLIALGMCNFVWACQCIHLTFDEEVTKSTRIFHGRVISVDDYTFNIAILNSWKGALEKDTLQLIQRSSCETGTFELNEEYVFYLRRNSVLNCSRTAPISMTSDSEILDAMFKNIGNRNLIESGPLTDRQISMLTSILDKRNLKYPRDLADRKVLFAIADEWVGKLSFLSHSISWDFWDVRLTELDNSGTLLLWLGNKWEKSLRKLKRSLKKSQ